MAPLVSVCMIVRDEERTLSQCLESLHGLYDELIVVDTGSTDRTVEIASDAGARVERFHWCDDFGKARNYACSFATGRWLFTPDGDEMLRPHGVGPKVRAFLEQAPTHIEKILVEQRTVLEDGSISILADRLYRNEPHLRWKYRIHEVIENDAAQTAMTRDFYLHHEPGAKRRDDMRVSQDREQMYLRSLALDMEELPEDPRPAFYYAETLYGAGRYEDALTAYDRYFELSGEGDDGGRRAVACRDAAVAAVALERHGQARALLFRSLDADWRASGTYQILAQLASNRGDDEESEHWRAVAARLDSRPSATKKKKKKKGRRR